MLRQAQHKRFKIGALVALVTLAQPGAAQTPAPTAPDPYARAIAAGYKALTLCSAVFVAGRAQAQVEALELTGTYPEYDVMLPTLAAKIDAAGGAVTVAYDAAMPPRRATFTAGKGCTILPIGSALPAPGRPIIWPAPRASDPRPWPLGDAGIAPKPSAALTRAVDAAFSGKPRTVGVVIVRDGRIVAERYADGFGPFVANRTWSVAKSLTGTLVGAAIQRKIVKLGDPLDIPEWASPTTDPRQAITLDQLLRMSSGLHSATAGNRTDAVYFGGTAVTEETIGWPLEAKPGTRFRYANNDILLALRSLRATMGNEAYQAFPQAALFAPVGMSHTVAEQDWHGNYVLSSQVWTTAHDLARFGLLYLNDGVWNAARILPAGWVKYVTSPSGPQPEGEFGYGATFWLMDRSPGVPADTYGAFGNRGQYVIIVPSRRVVIVRRGEDAAGAGNQFDIAKFTAEILAALG